MIYVALLRGINVGGNNKVEMPKLKQVFEHVGTRDVKTYINSGNVIFRDERPAKELEPALESAIKKEFGFSIKVLLRNINQIKTTCDSLPETWRNDSDTKCDVLFLWEEIDNQDIMKFFVTKPDIEDLVYIPGALIWRIGRQHINQGAAIKIVGTATYKQMTIRNCNTVRKIYSLMQELC